MLSVRPNPFEDFDSRTRHINTIVLFAPVQIEIAAWKMAGTDAFLATSEYRCYAGSAGTGAARHGDSAASFPCPHRKFRWLVDLDEVRVNSIGEEKVIFNGGPEFL
jgi:hypothetical protein